MFMSIIFKYTLFSLQGHIRILQGHKLVCTRTRDFNACFLHQCHESEVKIKPAILEMLLTFFIRYKW